MLPIGAIIRAVTLAAVTGVLALGFYWITGLRADLAVSELNREQLATAIQQQQTVIDQLRADQVAIAAAHRDLQSVTERSRRELQDLDTKLTETATGSRRDLGALAVRRPDSIARIVNQGTRDALRCLEIATGSTLTDSEMQADSAGKINQGCPDVANPRYSAAR